MHRGGGHGRYRYVCICIYIYSGNSKHQKASASGRLGPNMRPFRLSAVKDAFKKLEDQCLNLDGSHHQRILDRALKLDPNWSSLYNL